MARIKVTGYIDTATLSPEQVDLTDDTGLTVDTHTDLMLDLADLGLEDIDLELED